MISSLRNLAGLAFFAFAALLAGISAWHHPGIFSILFFIHNALLAVFYMLRQPAKSHDRFGLWLGLIAALLPVMPAESISQAGWMAVIPALIGYGLIIWSLCTLGRRFGVAPADRGLTSRGPYHLIRHPMYLGELLFRAAITLSSPDLLQGLLSTLLLTIIQVWRILREEKWISGYACYSRLVRWRLVPGVW